MLKSCIACISEKRPRPTLQKSKYDNTETMDVDVMSDDDEEEQSTTALPSKNTGSLTYIHYKYKP